MRISLPSLAVLWAALTTLADMLTMSAMVVMAFTWNAERLCCLVITDTLRAFGLSRCFDDMMRSVVLWGVLLVSTTSSFKVTRIVDVP